MRSLIVLEFTKKKTAQTFILSEKVASEIGTNLRSFVRKVPELLEKIMEKSLTIRKYKSKCFSSASTFILAINWKENNKKSRTLDFPNIIPYDYMEMHYSRCPL